MDAILRVTAKRPMPLHGVIVACSTPADKLDGNQNIQDGGLP